jgi:hypothetical protein
LDVLQSYLIVCVEDGMCPVEGNVKQVAGVLMAVQRLYRQVFEVFFHPCSHRKATVDGERWGICPPLLSTGYYPVHEER